MMLKVIVRNEVDYLLLSITNLQKYRFTARLKKPNQHISMTFLCHRYLYVLENLNCKKIYISKKRVVTIDI